MFVLNPADVLCCMVYISCLVLVLVYRDWAQQSKVRLKTETESSLRNVVF
jgi:hypothetical protein